MAEDEKVHVYTRFMFNDMNRAGGGGEAIWRVLSGQLQQRHPLIGNYTA